MDNTNNKGYFEEVNKVDCVDETNCSENTVAEDPKTSEEVKIEPRKKYIADGREYETEDEMINDVKIRKIWKDGYDYWLCRYCGRPNYEYERNCGWCNQ